MVTSKTLKSISFEYRRGPTQSGDAEIIASRLNAGEEVRELLKLFPDAIKEI